MRLKRPVKVGESIRLLKEDKQRVMKLTDNFSYFAELAILEKLDREEKSRE